MRSGIAVLGLAAALWLNSAAPGQPASSPERPGPTPGADGPPTAGRLDLTAGYLSCYFTLGPARIDREQLARDIAANVGGLGRWAGRKGIDLNKPTQEEPFFYQFAYSGHGGTSPLTLLIRSSPPPAEWAQADFDDSRWPRQRLPLLTWSPHVGGWAGKSQAVQVAHFRTRFFVDDPGRAGQLTLNLVYRGGVVVYLNGQEVARGHLPAGPVSADTPGGPYPEQAYVLPPRDLGGRVPADRPRPVVELWGPFPGPGPFITEGKGWNVPVEDLTSWGARPGGGQFVAARGEWLGIQALRDRRLAASLPVGLLRKGPNLIAIEIRRSDLNPVVLDPVRLSDEYGWGYFGAHSWLHCSLLQASLSSHPEGGVRLEARPAGPAAWTDDIHRRHFSPDFAPASRPAPIRLLAVRNGVFSGQAVIGAGQPVARLSARVSDLTGSDGRARIPASAVRVRYARGAPIAQLAGMGTDRGRPKERPEDSVYVALALARCAPDAAARQIAERIMTRQRLTRDESDTLDRAINQIRFFDQLSDQPPDGVEAGFCQPVWVTVKTPADAPPGRYAGTLTITADGREMAIPIELDLLAWTLPDPDRFETVVALEQSPYGVARHYKVEPWSPRHFELMGQSFSRLAQVGNDWLVLPVLLGSEFGNRDDSPVVFVRKSDGSFACDLERVGRYLDTAVANGCRPRRGGVCFVICHPTDNNLFVKPRVLVRDDSTGKAGPADVPAPDSPEARAMFSPFVDAVLAMLKSRGLEKNACWGYLWDTMDHERTGGYVAGMMKLMGELAPDVTWARGAHRIGKGIKGADPFTFNASIYSLPSPVRRDETTRQWQVFSHRGWSNPALHLVLPRVVNTVITIEGPSSPFSYRLAAERAIIAGGRGVARMGADYWAETYRDGWVGGGQVGMPVMALLAPGPAGAQTTARFECFREGIQEAEARILLERRLQGDWAQTPAGQAAQRMLDDRIEQTLFLPPGSSAPQIAEYYCGWQDRSRALFAAAAQAAGVLPPPPAPPASAPAGGH